MHQSITQLPNDPITDDQMLDVLIVGAGPAGSVAGASWRAPARACASSIAPTFPRDKLCGDTVNPGTLALLRRLGLGGDIDARGLRVDGMLRHRRARRRDRGPLSGRRVRPRDRAARSRLAAAAAGDRRRLRVRAGRRACARAVVDDAGAARSVSGVVVGVAARTRRCAAPVTIAADGRRFDDRVRPRPGAASRASAPLGDRRVLRELHADAVAPSRTPATDRPSRTRRDARPARPLHRRRAGARRPDQRLSRQAVGARRTPSLRDPAALLLRELARDPLLRDRAAGARLVAPPVVLGPLAVDVRDARRSTACCSPATRRASSIR